jgi:SHS2 domain-containing protein
MPYQYLEDIATSDAAFEAWGDKMEDMFLAAADATMNVMVENLDGIANKERRMIRVEAEAIDLLLFQLLQELIFFKDAERLLLRVSRTDIQGEAGYFTCAAETYGEEINPDKHELIVDVKAVTLHRFRVEQTPRGWEATVILDI